MLRQWQKEWRLAGETRRRKTLFASVEVSPFSVIRCPLRDNYEFLAEWPDNCDDTNCGCYGRHNACYKAAYNALIRKHPQYVSQGDIVLSGRREDQIPEGIKARLAELGANWHAIG